MAGPSAGFIHERLADFLSFDDREPLKPGP
jgi:hypothetical protein